MDISGNITIYCQASSALLSFAFVRGCTLSGAPEALRPHCAPRWLLARGAWTKATETRFGALERPASGLVIVLSAPCTKQEDMLLANLLKNQRLTVTRFM